MPLRNRVDPYGQLHAVRQRGAWMGNRGVLHDESKAIVAPWRVKRWITCALRFHGRHRQVFAPRRYSELFFLDEATAFAAGHRPCAECRRERYKEFRAAWGAAAGADEIDAVLHAERVTPQGGKRTYQAELLELPVGTMVEVNGAPCLVRDGSLWPWSFSGYGKPVRLKNQNVIVLTPRSIVRAFARGFQPLR